MPPVPTYDQAYGSLGNVYDPQTALVNQQVAELDPQMQAQQASLDQAKVNAFKDIDTSANAKGILFSGFSPDQQAQYIGTKYLPAVANLKTTYQNNKNALLGKINQLNADRSTEARGIVSTALTAAQTAAYNQAKLQIAAQKANSGSSNSSAAKTAQASQAADALNRYLIHKTGKDTYLSPYDYNAALSAWAQDGYSTSQFQAIFGHYKNPNQPKNQYQ